MVRLLTGLCAAIAGGEVLEPDAATFVELPVRVWSVLSFSVPFLPLFVGVDFEPYDNVLDHEGV